MLAAIRSAVLALKISLGVPLLDIWTGLLLFTWNVGRHYNSLTGIAQLTLVSPLSLPRGPLVVEDMSREMPSKNSATPVACWRDREAGLESWEECAGWNIRGLVVEVEVGSCIGIDNTFSPVAPW